MAGTPAPAAEQVVEESGGIDGGLKLALSPLGLGALAVACCGGSAGDLDLAVEYFVRGYGTTAQPLIVKITYYRAPAVDSSLSYSTWRE